MIIDLNPEFGYELVCAAPYAYWLKEQGEYMKYRVKNWDKFQHYKPKTYADETKKMPWFKLYGIDLLEDYE